MPRRLRCTLLCEDVEHERFFRPILERRFGRGQVHVDRGRSLAGITFVFSSYARWVKGLVRQHPTQNVGLVVVVDGDEAGHEHRLRELDQRLEHAGYEKRNAKEKIAACVPCRNIETWELWLCGRRDVNESEDYKADWQAEKRKDAMISRRAAQALFDQLSEEAKKTERDRLPSLTAGRAELQRLYSLADKD